LNRHRKLILVNPVNPSHRFGLGDAQVIFFPPLGLAIIAALTPEN
jgi:hypothetical protein